MGAKVAHKYCSKVPANFIKMPGARKKTDWRVTITRPAAYGRLTQRIETLLHGQSLPQPLVQKLASSALPLRKKKRMVARIIFRPLRLIICVYLSQANNRTISQNGNVMLYLATSFSFARVHLTRQQRWASRAHCSPNPCCEANELDNNELYSELWQQR